jgi:hypothetical protein
MTIGTQNILDIKTIDRVHAEVHFGDLYSITAYGTLTANQVLRLLLDTKTKNQHFFGEVYTSGPAIVNMYEDCYASTTAGLIDINNKNRTSTNVAVIKCYSTVAITTNGTLLINAMIVGNTGGGVGSNVVPSGQNNIRNNSEWILKKNSNYLLAVTNTASVPIFFNFIAETYGEE